MADESQDSAGEKTEEPSSYRIEEFRKRGEVASSRELTNAVVLLITFMTLVLSLAYLYETLTEFITWLYALDHRSAFTEKSMATIAAKTGTVLLKCTGPVFLAAVSTGVFMTVAQIGFLYAPEVLSLKLERLNPIQGFQKLFTMRSIVEAIKGIFKFVVVLAIVAFFIKDDLNSYSGFYNNELLSGFLYGKWIIVKLIGAILIGMFVIGLGDFAYQKISYHNKLKQTKEQAKKEQKEHDGNPEIKQKIKAIQRQMAQKRMMADVAKADVIVTNPTHISIAISYDSKTMISPLVVAKGADFLALKIREIANQNNIPIVENVMLARTIYKTVKVGNAIPRTLYKAVAEVLAFVFRLKKKRKALA